MIAKDLVPIPGSGSYFWLIAVGVRAGNGAGGPPGTQDGTRGATDPRAGSRAAASDACEARVPAPGDRATLSSRDMHQSPFRGRRPQGVVATPLVDEPFRGHHIRRPAVPGAAWWPGQAVPGPWFPAARG